MKVVIKDKEINLKYSFRALMIYENITKKSFNPQGISDVVIFFYSIVVASSKDTSLTFDDFLDWMDENTTAINDFSLWLTDVFTSQSGLVNTDIKVDSPSPEQTEKN